MRALKFKSLSGNIIALTTILSISLLILIFGCRAGVDASALTRGGGGTGSAGGDTSGDFGKTIVFSPSSSLLQSLSAPIKLSSTPVGSLASTPKLKLLSADPVFSGVPNDTVEMSPIEVPPKPRSGSS